MPKRQVFFSFRYLYDAWRASQVRNMGKVSNDSTFSDNDWEEVKEKTSEKIEKWINDEMKKRSCVIVLIGEHTQGRKWINYEIKQAWKAGKGIVGIYIHGLENAAKQQAKKGKNPFKDFCVDKKINYIAQHEDPADPNEINLASVIKAYDTPYLSSKYVYGYIKDHIEEWIEEAIEIRNKYPK